jgi:glycosyltransferase involved in cell wall biosynthesis
MKIAHLTTVHDRDDSRIVSKECASLAKQFSVILIIADGLGDGKTNGITVIDAGKPASRAKRFLNSFGAVRRAVIGSGADVVHFHDPELIPLGFYLRSRGIKVVYDVHEDVPRDILLKEWIPTAIRKPVAFGVSMFEAAAGKVFNGIVTATPTIANRFPARKTQVIRNLPLLSEFETTPPYHGREELFAHMGTLSEARGIIETVKAFAILNGPRLVLGGLFNTDELEARTKAEPGWRFVDHLGFIDRKAVVETLNRSRAGLCTLLPTQTHLDSYPVKLFEYMSASLPVILSDFPVWRGLLDGVKCAIFVDPSKPIEIAKAMRWVLDNPDKAEAMGRAGREAVETKLNWLAEERALIEFYKRIC